MEHGMRTLDIAQCLPTAAPLLPLFPVALLPPPAPLLGPSASSRSCHQAVSHLDHVCCSVAYQEALSGDTQ